MDKCCEEIFIAVYCIKAASELNSLYIELINGGLWFC